MASSRERKSRSNERVNVRERTSKRLERTSKEERERE